MIRDAWAFGEGDGGGDGIIERIIEIFKVPINIISIGEYTFQVTVGDLLTLAALVLTIWFGFRSSPAGDVLRKRGRRANSSQERR